MPNLTMNVGFQGQRRSNADIAEPSLLTLNGHEPLRYGSKTTLQTVKEVY
jgi:hypothetical protein